MNDKINNSEYYESVEEAAKDLERIMNEKYPLYRAEKLLFKGLSDKDADEIFATLKKRILSMVRQNMRPDIIYGELKAHMDSTPEQFRKNLSDMKSIEDKMSDSSFRQELAERAETDMEDAKKTNWNMMFPGTIRQPFPLAIG